MEGAGEAARVHVEDLIVETTGRPAHRHPHRSEKALICIVMARLAGGLTPMLLQAVGDASGKKKTEDVAFRGPPHDPLLDDRLRPLPQPHATIAAIPVEWSDDVNVQLAALALQIDGELSVDAETALGVTTAAQHRKLAVGRHARRLRRRARTETPLRQPARAPLAHRHQGAVTMRVAARSLRPGPDQSPLQGLYHGKIVLSHVEGEVGRKDHRHLEI